MNYILRKIEKKIYINNIFFNYYFFYIFKKEIFLFYGIFSFNFIFGKSIFFIKKYLSECGFNFYYKKK